MTLTILKIAIALQCIGLFRATFLDGTALGTTLFMSLGWSESGMLAVEHGIAWTGLLAGLSVLARPTRVAAGVVTLWFAEVAVLTVVQGGSFGASYAAFAHATRYALPLAVVVSLWPADPQRRSLWVERILRVAVSTTFVAHGLEAIAANPEFIDYIITAFRRFGIEVCESATRIMLLVIGVQDLLLAGLILARRWRWVAAYMALWGAITAGSRMVHMGFAKWPATLLRAANAGVPLALLAMWHAQQTKQRDDEQR